MIPALFDYARAESVEEAISLLGSNEDAKLLAGGHSLLPAMKLRIARPSMLVATRTWRPGTRSCSRRSRSGSRPKSLCARRAGML